MTEEHIDPFIARELYAPRDPPRTPREIPLDFPGIVLCSLVVITGFIGTLVFILWILPKLIRGHA